MVIWLINQFTKFAMQNINYVNHYCNGIKVWLTLLALLSGIHIQYAGNQYTPFSWAVLFQHCLGRKGTVEDWLSFWWPPLQSRRVRYSTGLLNNWCIIIIEIMAIPNVSWIWWVHSNENIINMIILNMPPREVVKHKVYLVRRLVRCSYIWNSWYTSQSKEIKLRFCCWNATLPTFSYTLQMLAAMALVVMSIPCCCPLAHAITFPSMLSNLKIINI